jgi:hypothetical protein
MSCGFAADGAHNSSASSGNLLQQGIISFEKIGLLAVDQRKLRSSADADADTIGGSFAESSRVLGSAPGAGHHPLIGLLGCSRAGLTRLGRSRSSSSDGSQSCDHKRKRAGDGTSEYHDLNPNPMSLHGGLASLLEREVWMRWLSGQLLSEKSCK